ncbi:MAG: hypothetical protein KKE44_20085 [Proteobacteria bacterium]|nr:hypothetical protein [Pseudomonadota bacterium]MBU1585032.1 hypothetical protein [Pseudomonadota bacterium]MBU2453738.1 hypothetical protein [Pseudomonadota bacterium]MBU2629037.1 hypothetical protein [Pseudomonadota bacterium]
MIKKNIKCVLFGSLVILSVAVSALGAKMGGCIYCGNFFCPGTSEPMDRCMEEMDRCRRNNYSPRAILACSCLATAALRAQYPPEYCTLKTSALFIGATPLGNVLGAPLIDPDNLEEFLDPETSVGRKIELSGAANAVGGKLGAALKGAVLVDNLSNPRSSTSNTVKNGLGFGHAVLEQISKK